MARIPRIPSPVPVPHPGVQYHEAGQVRERKQVVIDHELDRIRAEHGTVTIPLFLDAARDPARATHKYFEWDDVIAGERYRHQQALQMIMASRMVAEILHDGTVVPTARAHRVAVRRLVSSFRGEGFKLRTDALANADDRAVMIRRFAERLRGWCRATADIEEFAVLREDIERLLDEILPEAMTQTA